MNIGSSTLVQPQQTETPFPAQTQQPVQPQQTETLSPKQTTQDIASPTPQQSPAPPQQPEEKSFWEKAGDLGKGYLNTMMGNHPIGLALGLFGVRPPFQQEGKQFRQDIGHPAADYAAAAGTAMGLPWVAGAANATNAGMYMQDGQLVDAGKSLLATIPEGAAAKGLQTARNTYGLTKAVKSLAGTA